MTERGRTREPTPKPGSITLANGSPLGTSHGQLVLRSAAAHYRSVRLGHEPPPRLATDLNLDLPHGDRTGVVLDYHAAAEATARRWLDPIDLP